MQTQSTSLLIVLIIFIFFPITGNLFIQLPYGNISPLFTFGQSIQRKGRYSLRETFFLRHRNRGSQLISFNNIYYGFTEKITGLISVPIILKDNREQKRGQGLADISLRSEFVIYQDKSDDHRYNITGVLSLRLPTATTEFKTRFASKALSFFFGGTQSLIIPQWYLYSAAGYLIRTKHNKLKFGNEFIADLGMGRAIFSASDSYLIIFAEIGGLFLEPNTENNIKNLQSGEFVLYCGPTFRYRKHHWLLQGGIQYPVSRHRRSMDSENVTNFRAALSAAYSF